MSDSLTNGHKIRLLSMIRANQFELFGTTSKEKEEAWKQIHRKSTFLGIVHGSRSWEFIRDSMWGCWKSRAIAKWRKHEDATKLNDVELKVIRILRDVQPDLVRSVTTATTNLNFEKPASTLQNNATTEENDKGEYKDKKKKLKLELLELEIYHKKLMCIGLERHLKIKSKIMEGCDSTDIDNSVFS